MAANVGHRRAKSDINLGSLLRLFKSGFFDSWITVSYLYRYPDTPGVQDYLVNELYKLSDEEVEFYLFQLCNLLIQRKFGGTDALERFILDKSSKSIHFALQLAWIFQSTVEDPQVKDIQIKEYCKRMREDVEIACVNVRRPLPRSVREKLKQQNTGGLIDPSVKASGGVKSGAERETSSSGTTPGESSSFHSYMNCFVKDSEEDHGGNDAVDFALEKSDRFEYFNRLIAFVDQLQHMSDKMRFVLIENRQAELQRQLEVLNRSLLVDGTGLYLPITQANLPHFCIVHIVVEDAKVLNSRDRVPFLLSLEVLKSKEPCSYPDLHKLAASHRDDIMKCVEFFVREEEERRTVIVHGEDGRKTGLPEEYGKRLLENDAETLARLKSLDLDSRTLDDIPKQGGKDEKEISSILRELEKQTPESESSSSSSSSSSAPPPSDKEESRPMKLPISELWAHKKERIRKKSPFGRLPSWDLFSVIVKFGDDLRQEQLALQLVTQFYKIFKEANLPIYLKPYSILITSCQSGLVETVLDTASLHQIKKSPGFTTLDNYYKTVYNHPSDEYKVALYNYVESMAGYSILTYLLQIKDRHNGNLLIDAEGHVIHIDFGFMLSNSPGFNMNFESAPFKLTQEFIDVMGGVDSNVFQYFKALMIRGFLECRKHCEKIIFLVEMMQEGSHMPCFIGGQAAVDNLRQRFNVAMPEDEYIQFVEDLITKSCNNWHTRQYDKFQYLTNGVFY